jgi:hypothetical protein
MGPSATPQAAAVLLGLQVCARLWKSPAPHCIQTCWRAGCAVQLAAVATLVSNPKHVPCMAVGCAGWVTHCKPVILRFQSHSARIPCTSFKMVQCVFALGECTPYRGGWVAANGWLLIAGEMRPDALHGSGVRHGGGHARCMVSLFRIHGRGLWYGDDNPVGCGMCVGCAAEPLPIHAAIQGGGWHAAPRSVETIQRPPLQLSDHTGFMPFCIVVCARPAVPTTWSPC